MTNNQAILHAYKIEGNGKGTPLFGQDISDTIKADALAWVHLDANFWFRILFV